MDVFDSDVADSTSEGTYMKCKLFYGDYEIGAPTKIVCGDFQTQIATGQSLKFAIGIQNPVITGSTPNQMSLPVLIHSFDPMLFKKTNFDIVNGAVYVKN